MADEKCRRCASDTCIGRYYISGCDTVIDGKTAVDEAFALLDAKYAPEAPEPAPEPVELAILGYELLGGDKLIPWDPKRDRRAKAKGAPRVGATQVWAQWGECTACARGGDPMQAAAWRQENGQGTTRQSLCEEHAQALVQRHERIKNPLQVPNFTTAEEALAWLDQQTAAAG